MNTVAELIGKTKHLLPDLDTLGRYLADEYEVISRAFPESESVLRARGIVRPELEAAKFNELDAALERERVRIVKAGQRAVEKIRNEGENAKLEPDEALGYETIVLPVGRPAILIQNGHFFPPPVGWEILEENRGSIEKTCKSIGRIEFSGHPRIDWIGTGFLVAENVVMTNRHVAKEFCCWGERGQWVFEPGIESRINYIEELGSAESSDFTIEKVIGIHERFDLALLKISDESFQGMEQPEPLTLASEVPDELIDRKVYAVGYPAIDPYRNDPEVMRRIFSGIYGVKRLQPGKVIEFLGQDSLIHHDCSTLGGNSGSCVSDIEMNRVIGLHYSGRYLQHNNAIALWTLRDDPMLNQAGVNFD